MSILFTVPVTLHRNHKLAWKYYTLCFYCSDLVDDVDTWPEKAGSKHRPGGQRRGQVMMTGLFLNVFLVISAGHTGLVKQVLLVKSFRRSDRAEAEHSEGR